jgi:D-serine deaminase-like pyridoxal phosphate-dependent protein
MTPAQRYESYRYALREVRKPCAFVDLDRLAHNAALVREYTGGMRVRLGSKSIRCVAIIERLLAEHDPFEGLLCYTAEEAVWLTTRGLDDLVVAYPTWDAGQIAAVAGCVSEGAMITLMADCAAHLERYARIAREAGVVLPVCLDLDMGTRHLGLHFGALRTALRTRDAVLELCAQVADDPNLTLDGLMGYEGQIAGTADAVPGERAMNAVKRGLKAMSAPRVVARRAELVAAVRAAGHDLRFVNAGGSGSLKLNAAEDAITEATAGSAFYSPVLFGHHRDYGYLPAAGYAVEVVRRPERGVFTCLGGGYPASGAPGAATAPVPWLPEGATLTPFEGAGEVQTPVRYTGPVALGLGSPVFLRHAKAGELCERFTSLHLIADGVLVDTVPTYRGQGQCFL